MSGSIHSLLLGLHSMLTPDYQGTLWNVIDEI